MFKLCLSPSGGGQGGVFPVTSMKYFFTILLILSDKLSFACQCPLSTLDSKELVKYEIIFKGKVKSINLNKENSEAIFIVSELYKGMLADNFKIF